MKAKEMRDRSIPEVSEFLRDREKELARLHIRRRIDSIDKTHQFKVLRRDIARAKTVLHGQQMMGKQLDGKEAS
ncbi:MAG: 50S ribosomal protein L29 [Puniceicoccales bacterium]|jgi:large subunit ribosomal protein L29|nr:50S ribosomal protein L29 [Puniceicoccales bacterium]